MEQDRKEKVVELEDRWETVKDQMILLKVNLDLADEKLLEELDFEEGKGMVDVLANKNAKTM